MLAFTGFCHEALLYFFGFSVLWVELGPPKRYVEALTHRTQNMTLFGNTVIADVVTEDEVIQE